MQVLTGHQLKSPRLEASDPQKYYNFQRTKCSNATTVYIILNLYIIRLLIHKV